MIDDRSRGILEDILRRESRSFLQYMAESYPWTTSDEQGLLSRLQQISAEQKQAIGEVTRLLLRRRVELPYIDPFPVAFTSWNFISLRQLLPRLVDEVRHGVAALNRDLAEVRDPQARAVVDHFLQMKTQHLRTLEALTTPSTQLVAAS